MKNIVVDTYGINEYDLDVIAMYMDEDLRDEVNYDLAPCTPQEFYNEYVKRHLEKFGEEFFIDAGGAY